jgi:hypothetical protein
VPLDYFCQNQVTPALFSDPELHRRAARSGDVTIDETAATIAGNTSARVVRETLALPAGRDN